MGVKLNSTGGGSVTLDAPNTASNLTVTLPSASGTLVSTGSPFAGGTANGVLYLNGSSVPTAGSALTFDGSNTLQINGSANAVLKINAIYGSGTSIIDLTASGSTAQDTRIVGGAGSTSNISFITSGSEQMRLTSTGLGIGTSSPGAKLDVYNSAAAAVGNEVLRLRYTTATSNATGDINFTNSSGTALNKISSICTSGSTVDLGFSVYNSGITEAMRITAAGNVGIGTSSPASKLHVTGTGTVIQYLTSSNGGATRLGFDSSGVIYNWIEGQSGGLRFATSDTERMRIDSSGNLLVGTTSSADNSGVGTKIRTSSTVATINCTFNSDAGGSTFQLYNTHASFSGYRFYVNYNGGVQNYQAYDGNLSDERTKDRIELAGGYLDKICAIPVKLFNYKGEPEGEQKTLGVIAQDVEKVAPELVSNEGFGETPEDGIPLKTIYQTDLQYALMKAIQELKAELDATKAEVAALKG